MRHSPLLKTLFTNKPSWLSCVMTSHVVWLLYNDTVFKVCWSIWPVNLLVSSWTCSSCLCGRLCVFTNVGGFISFKQCFFQPANFHRRYPLLADGVPASSCSVSVEMGSCSLVICDSTCLKKHCSINVDGICSWKCGAAVRALCWSVPVSASYIPTNVGLYVPALYGMAAASRRVIGYQADCFACRPFFRPFVVSFFQSPLPLPLSPQLLFSRTWTHTNIE